MNKIFTSADEALRDLPDGATLQLRQDNRRGRDQTGQRFDSLLMTPGAEVIDEN